MVIFHGYVSLPEGKRTARLRFTVALKGRTMTFFHPVSKTDEDPSKWPLLFQAPFYPPVI